MIDKEKTFELKLKSTKFSTRIYQGPRRIVPVASTIGIRRIYAWSKILQRYGDPPRGGRYLARRERGRGEETKTFQHLQDAKDWQAGRHLGPTAESLTGTSVLTVGRALNQWETIRWPSLRESTRLYYQKKVCFFEPILHIPLAELTPKFIDEWLALLKTPRFAEHYQPSRQSLDKELCMLKALVAFAIEHNDDLKLVSPFRKRHDQLARLKEKGESISKFMTEEELETWLLALKFENPTIWALALTQTRQILRVSEVAAMKWSNLDWRNRNYVITEHVFWPRISGGKAKLLPGTKTNKAGEIFNSPLREDVLQVLRDLEPSKTGDLVFTETGELLEYRRIQHVYNKVFKKCGLRFRSTHCLRHSGATSFLEQTGDVLALQQMGNWTDSKMAMHYGKILGSRAKNAIAKMEDKNRSLKLVRDDERWVQEVREVEQS